MAATFPLAIRTFTTKRNLLDDVDASHINALQDEIDAIETTIGLNPHQDATLVNTYNGQSAPTNAWGSLAERLNFLQRRKDIPFWDLYRDASQVFYSADSYNDRINTVGFPAPAALNDTHGLFNGTGITIKRAGYYHVTAKGFFGDNFLKGSRMLTIRKNGSSYAHASGLNLTGESPPSHWWLHTSDTGYFNVGDKITLTAETETGPAFGDGPFAVAYMHLTGFMIRDL